MPKASIRWKTPFKVPQSSVEDSSKNVNEDRTVLHGKKLKRTSDVTKKTRFTFKRAEPLARSVTSDITLKPNLTSVKRSENGVGETAHLTDHATDASHSTENSGHCYQQEKSAKRSSPQCDLAHKSDLKSNIVEAPKELNSEIPPQKKLPCTGIVQKVLDFSSNEELTLQVGVKKSQLDHSSDFLEAETRPIDPPHGLTSSLSLGHESDHGLGEKRDSILHGSHRVRTPRNATSAKVLNENKKTLQKTAQELSRLK